jgi:hypothetical protein
MGDKEVTKMLKEYAVILAMFSVTLAGCNAIGKQTPTCYCKPEVPYGTPQAAQAAQNFWVTFHSANYAASDQALSELVAASQNDPGDARLVSLVGLCSFWKVLEKNRAGLPSQSVHGLATQSLTYVEEAGRRDPSNRLTPGFISSAKYQLGAIERNGCRMNQALVELQQNTNIYPQFHGFVEGWVLTAMLPPEHPAYNHAVEAYYKTLDSCAGIRIPRSFPRLGEFGFYILAKKSKNETVCYNTNIAPHNVEGTLYGLGDALVKQRKLRQAELVYESIRRVPAYPTWPYKDLLAQRLNNLQNLHVKFVADSGCVDVQEPAMLFQSSIACTCCHATCR